MTRSTQLEGLQRLGRMVLDARLADLEQAARARAVSLARLQDLEVPPATDLPSVAAAQAGLRYARWADARRAEINLVLARQTAAWLQAQDAARLAFGRAEALRKLAERQES